MIILYKCLSEINVFEKENHFVGNTRVLRMFCNVVSIKLLPLLIEIHVLFDVNVCRHLRQMVV